MLGGSYDLGIPRLSPDNTELLYLVVPKRVELSQTVRIMRVPLSGGTPQVVLEGPWIWNQQCARLPSTLCVYTPSEPNQQRFLSFDPVTGAGAQHSHIVHRQRHTESFVGAGLGGDWWRRLGCGWQKSLGGSIQECCESSTHRRLGPLEGTSQRHDRNGLGKRTGEVLGWSTVPGRAPPSLLRSDNRSFQRVVIGELLIPRVAWVSHPQNPSSPAASCCRHDPLKLHSEFATAPDNPRIAFVNRPYPN